MYSITLRFQVIGNNYYRVAYPNSPPQLNNMIQLIIANLLDNLQNNRDLMHVSSSLIYCGWLIITPNNHHSLHFQRGDKQYSFVPPTTFQKHTQN